MRVWEVGCPDERPMAPMTRRRTTTTPTAGGLVGTRGCGQGPARGVAPPPAGGHEPALEVLPRRRQQALGVHLHQAAEAELAQAVPLLGLPEEGFDPHLPLTEGLLVGLGGVVAPHPVEVRLVEGAVHVAARRAGGA